MVLIAKQYTSSVLLAVWHSDVQPNLIGAEAQNNSSTPHIETRLEALSEETIARGHLEELISKHGLFLLHGKPAPGAIGEMAGEITITLPDSVLQSKTPSRWQRLLPPDAVEISFQYFDPAKAQAVANDLGDIMIDEYGKELERHNADTIKLLSNEVDETRGKLAQSQRQIKILKEKYSGSMAQDFEDNVKVLQALQLQLERSAQATSKTDASGAALPDSPKPNTPDAMLAALKTKLVALRSRYSDEYPEVIETKSQIAILEKEVANLGKQAAAARPPDSTAGPIQQHIADYQRAIAETPAHEEAISAVNRDFGILAS